MIFTLASSPSLSVPLRTRIVSKNDRVKTLVKSLAGVANAAMGQLNSAVAAQTRIPPVAADHQLVVPALVGAPFALPPLGVLIVICILLACFKTSFSGTVPPVRRAHRQTHNRSR